jgi:hypothetical protein
MVRLPAPMFVVPVHTAGFPPGTVPYTGQLRFSPDALAWALFTTGRLPGDVTRYGAASLYECVHRVAIIPAYIRRRAGGAFVRSQLCTDLDRSEKVGVSYSLGMALTRLFTAMRLRVPFLLHVDRYGHRYDVRYVSRRSACTTSGTATPPRPWPPASRPRSSASDSATPTSRSPSTPTATSFRAWTSRRQRPSPGSSSKAQTPPRRGSPAAMLPILLPKRATPPTLGRR